MTNISGIAVTGLQKVFFSIRAKNLILINRSCYKPKFAPFLADFDQFQKELDLNLYF